MFKLNASCMRRISLLADKTQCNVYEYITFNCRQVNNNVKKASDNKQHFRIS